MNDFSDMQPDNELQQKHGPGAIALADSVTEHLPKELRALVRYSIDQFGAAVKRVHGDSLFEDIERLRVQLKDFRQGDEPLKKTLLEKVYAEFSAYTDERLAIIVSVYSRYLEVINRCELVYRDYRLQARNQTDQQAPAPAQPPATDFIYVFTAHPTEARSGQSIYFLRKIDELLARAIDNHADRPTLQLQHLFTLLLHTNLTKTKKPRVVDEAEHIYSIVCSAEILNEQIRLFQAGVNVRFRTWVGGDKDGHPFVDEKVMQQSLQKSRQQLLAHVSDKIAVTSRNLKRLDPATGARQKKLHAALEKLLQKKRPLQTLQTGDGRHVAAFHRAFAQFSTVYEDLLGPGCPELESISAVLQLYPALVVPLEMREDAELVHQALKPGKSAIRNMLKNIARISRGHAANDYARGLILSMTQSADDIAAGIRLMRQCLGDRFIPVIPLFETRQALEQSATIISKVIGAQKTYIKQVKKLLNGRLEVMLGYSDSAKEVGVLRSRIAISETMQKLESAICQHDGLRPVYFHGSGGSVERGGGSIQEQMSWWPAGALKTFKTTIQGEMIARTFGKASVFRSQVEQILQISQGGGKDHGQLPAALDSFSDRVAQEYQQLVASETFLELVKRATPYSFLGELKIGSRPTARSTGGQKLKIRAIPWVLCFTQTRILLPVWWGIGSAWQRTTEADKKKIRELVQSSDLFASYINILGFTLAKIEFAVFQFYLEQNLPAETARAMIERFRTELTATQNFYREVTGRADYMEYKKWLGSSIRLRSPMIHPLNLAQIIAIKRGNMNLLRETITGIACGMLTTG